MSCRQSVFVYSVCVGILFSDASYVEGGNGHVEKNCPQRGAHMSWVMVGNPKSFPPTVVSNAFHIAGPLSVYDMGFQEWWQSR